MDNRTQCTQGRRTSQRRPSGELGVSVPRLRDSGQVAAEEYSHGPLVSPFPPWSRPISSARALRSIGETGFWHNTASDANAVCGDRLE